MPIENFWFATGSSWILSLIFAAGLNNGLSRNEASFSIYIPRIINFLLFLFPYKRKISIILVIVQSCNLMAIVVLALSNFVFCCMSLPSFFLYCIIFYSVVGFGVIIFDISQNPN